MAHIFILTFAFWVGLASGAQAGFQWVAPATPTIETPATVDSQKGVPAAPLIIDAVPPPETRLFEPSTTAAEEVIAKIKEREDDHNQGRAFKKKTLRINPDPLGLSGATPKAPSRNVRKAPVTQSNIPQLPVNGFGSDIALALALQQIVPPQYSYSFATDLNPGIAVSWDGQGRNWDQVLGEMLGQQGLKADIYSRSVKIARNDMQPVRVQASTPIVEEPMIIEPQSQHEAAPSPRRKVILAPSETPQYQNVDSAAPMMLLPLP